jgi:REP element-mobilizing transposase RayT
VGSRFEMFAHLVWGTKRRRPLITVDVEQGIYRAVEAKCFELGCAPRAIGGTADHVHLLSRIHPSISMARGSCWTGPIPPGAAGSRRAQGSISCCARR